MSGNEYLLQRTEIIQRMSFIIMCSAAIPCAPFGSKITVSLGMWESVIAMFVPLCSTVIAMCVPSCRTDYQ